MKRDPKEKVKETILERVKDYLKKINQSYKSIGLVYINSGATSHTLDSGAYLVEVITNPDKLYFFVKKNTTLPYRRFLSFYNPIKETFYIPFSKRNVHQPVDHGYSYVKKARAIGVAIPEYFYVDKKTRVVIEERVEGLDIGEAFLKNPSEALKFTYQAGRNLAKLHKHGLKFGELKPAHIFFDFEKKKINFVDCEQLGEAKDINDYLHDFHLLASYLVMTIPNKYIKPFWKQFISGYQSIKTEKIEEILSLARSPQLLPWISRSFLKFFNYLNFLTWKISHGHLRL